MQNERTNSSHPRDSHWRSVAGTWLELQSSFFIAQHLFSFIFCRFYFVQLASHHHRHTASGKNAAASWIDCVNQKKWTLKWSCKHTHTLEQRKHKNDLIMAHWIWQRFKMKWILALFVIQFIDLSINRKYPHKHSSIKYPYIYLVFA